MEEHIHTEREPFTEEAQKEHEELLREYQVTLQDEDFQAEAEAEDNRREKYGPNGD